MRKNQSIDIIKEISIILSQMSLSGQGGLFVFDLDSTLFDVSPRIQHILTELAADPEQLNQHPEVRNKLQQARVEHRDWGFAAALERAEIHSPPQSDLYKLVHRFWAERFFSNSYLIHDQPYEGAVDFVNKIYENHLNQIVYLTGRDIHRMLQGTQESLIRNGFPLDRERAHLVLKDHHSIEDASFKSDWFHGIEKAGFEHIWFFENEPVNINLVRQQHPEIKIVCFDSTHSGKATLPSDLPLITHFKI